MSESEKIVRRLFDEAGIAVNGKNPWDIQIHNTRCYDRFILDQSIGFGEAYMDGWWDADQLDETIARITRAHLERRLQKSLKVTLFFLRRKLFNISGKKRAFTVGQQHYDIGNELYEAMLDNDLNYSCGYWKDLGDVQTAWKMPENLEKAQIAKLDLACRKLYLKKGQRVLDIGCGWGNFAKHAAAKYGVTVVGITVSKEQAALARKRCEGLPVEILVRDYRDLGPGQFDRIVSIGMFEHVTHKNYDTFMRVAEKALRPDGLFLLHTIGSNVSTFANDPWNEKYIFPNSHLPSMKQISNAVEKKFIIEDFHNFGVYYYPTLMSWFHNFDSHWGRLSAAYPEKYTKRFYRMWKYYLLSCAGAFKSRQMQLWQIVLSRYNKLQLYTRVQ